MLSLLTLWPRHVLVWVTKMDDVTVQFEAARFEEIKKAVTAYLKEVGYKQKAWDSGAACVVQRGFAKRDHS